MEKRGEIILYQPDSEVRLEVRLEEETVWLNRQQLSELFNRDVKTIGKHVNNALKEELAGMATVANFATVQKEGDRTVTRQVELQSKIQPWSRIPAMGKQSTEGIPAERPCHQLSAGTDGYKAPEAQQPIPAD